jgi:hypothetical protein
MRAAGVTGRRRDLPPAVDRVHPTIAAVFEALEAAGVRWSVLRGEARLESPPHDVDLLVASPDLPRFFDAVRPLGFIAVPTWARGTHRFYVAYLTEFDHWLVIDVVTELSYGPGYAIRTDAADACLARRERVGCLSLLAADDAFWTLLFHCLLDRRDIPAHQKERLCQLHPGASGDSMLARFADALCPPGWDADRMIAAVGRGDWSALSQLGPQMSRRWRRRHPARYWPRDLADRLRWRVAPLHTVVALRGLIVVIAADDSETAQRLTTGLRGGFYFPVHVLDGRAVRGAGARPRVRGATQAIGRLLATYHTARGRLVVACTSSCSPPCSRDTSSARLRPDVLVVVRSTASGASETPGASADPGEAARAEHRVLELRSDDLVNGRRRTIALIWRTYGERHGWNVAPTR